MLNLDWNALDGPSLEGLDTVASPGLLVDADRVAKNLEGMIAIVDGDPSRLRPHVKTHKMPAVVQLQVAAGIGKFKAATFAEAEMVARAGGQDVLVAYQPVGPNIARLAKLIGDFPEVSFAALVDDQGVAASLASACGSPAQPLRVFIDVDCGMHRTGIAPGEGMKQLHDQIVSHASLRYAGLHVYDGHVHQPSRDQRHDAATEIIARIRDFDQSNPSPAIVGGGSPTFGCWAGDSRWECSPGTTIFWDIGYGKNYPDLPFSIALALLTRVISKPGPGRLCLDLGYKSIASEMPLPDRLVLPAIPDATFAGQSEEHLVVETALADEIAIGDSFLAFPRHVCPTVAMHDFVTIVRDGRVTSEIWEVTARSR